MSSDFRLDVYFPQHLKFRRLRTRLGDKGGLAWILLLAYTAAHRPDGRLTGLSAKDIEEIVEWRGPKDLVSVLLDVGYLDRDGETYSLHNWAERQPWIVSGEARRAKAREAAKARWERPDQKGQCLSKVRDATSMLRACSAQCPPPKPIPIPRPAPSEPHAPKQGKTKKEVNAELAWFETEFRPAYPANRQNNQLTTAKKWVRDHAAEFTPEFRVMIMTNLAAWKTCTDWTMEEGKYVPGIGKFFTEERYKRRPAAPPPAKSNGTSSAIPPTDDEYYGRRALS